MRFAIAALISLFLVASIFGQDAQSAQDTQSATDSTQATADSAPATDGTQPAPDATQPAPEAAQAAPDQTQAQEPAKAASGSAFSFQGGINLGSDVFLTGPANGPETWTRVGFQPDLSFGKIGFGIDLSFHFQLYQTSSDAFTLYPGDWVPNYQGNGKTIFDVYLPKILYVRYGLKGQDPLFVKLGSIDDLSLGNGFIISNYSNMHFLPQQRIFGLDLGIDGSLFGFPMVGFEALTGNLARFDVVGGRVFVRPLIQTSIPLLKNMQVGATVVADTNPDLYVNSTASAVAAYGADAMVPLIESPVFPLAAFTDIAFDPNNSTGWMIGVGGRALGFLTYGAQIRILQNGFIPSYFDANYDIFRATKYLYMQKPLPGGIYEGWAASAGTSILGDKFIFNVSLDGPFSGKGVVSPVSSANTVDYPHLRGILRFGEIKSFPIFFDASYDKYTIGAAKGFFQDLVDPTDAVIGLNVNFRTGASVLTLAYDAKWNPATQQFEVTSSLQASMKF